MVVGPGKVSPIYLFIYLFIYLCMYLFIYLYCENKIEYK
jgi:hypothetical protein